MVWIYTATEPNPVETKTHLGMKQRTINYNIVPLGEEFSAENKYKYQTVTLEPGVWNYDAIVSALITAEYPRDKMDAVINNYLSDQANDTATEEMLQMQSWRKKAKQIAKDMLELQPETPAVQNYQPDGNDTTESEG